MSHAAFNIVLYADQKSRVDFTHPENSAIVKHYRRVFNDRARFRFVDADDVQSGRAFKDQPHEFILPGIFSEKCHYADHLGTQGNENIRNFVREGNIFTGYCAGAYYASRSTRYIPVWGPSRQRDADTNLNLLPVDAIGPVGTYCQPVADPREKFPEGLYRVDAVPVTLEGGKIVKMAYGFGPAFRVATGSDIRVVGRYAGIRGTPAAIIEGHYGKGRVTLYGTLPQYQVETQPDPYVWRPKETKDLLDSLYAHREDLIAFAQSQFQRMAAHHGLHL